MGKFLLLSFPLIVGIFLVGCGSNVGVQTVPLRVYFKAEISALAACENLHSECGGTDERCVAAPAYLGGLRKCMSFEDIGDFFDCNYGELIIFPDEPYQLNCISENPK